LGHRHRSLGGEAQPIGGGLLEGRGDERGRRARQRFLLLNITDLELGPLELIEDLVGLILVAGLKLLAVDLMEFGLEGIVLEEPLALLTEVRAFLFF